MNYKLNNTIGRLLENCPEGCMCRQRGVASLYDVEESVCVNGDETPASVLGSSNKASAWSIHDKQWSAI